MADGNPQGIDVSHFQGDVDWNKVAAGGQSFVSIKATQGQSGYSAASYYTDNIEKAREAGLISGGYHFFSGGDDGKAQADYFLSVAKPKSGDLLPMLDLEDTNGASASMIVEEALAWLSAVENAVGKKPFLYTTASFFAGIGNPSGFEDYPLWVANYGVSKPHMPQGWKIYTIWQHSQSGSCNGVSGNVDMDSFNGPRSTLDVFRV